MRILVVDDEPTVLKIVVKTLSRQGYGQIDLAESGRQLVKFWLQWKHPVVISDIELPEKDGITACKEILDLDPQVTIIMMTGCPEAARRAEEAGLGPCLHKPFLPEELLARLPNKTNASSDGGC